MLSRQSRRKGGRRVNSKWALQDAKNRLSELVDRALRVGPQTITRRGKDTVVVVSVEQFGRLTRGEGGLVTFLRESPLKDVELDLRRTPDIGREVDL
jgi:prevent-host-death family protein